MGSPVLIRILATAALLPLCACSGFPEIAEVEGAAGPPPMLQPIDGLLPDPAATADPAASLAARAAGLKARAAAIGTP